MQGQKNSNRERNNRLAMYTGIGMGVIAVLFVVVPNFLLIFSPHFHGSVLWDAPEVEDFSLPRADGGTLRLSELKGQVVVLYFGYTTCADVCPATLYNLNQTMKELGDRAGQVSVVFVTVDPEVDTPGKLGAYLNAFNPDFIGLTGTEDQLQPVYDQFKVNILRADEGEAAANTGIGHTTSLFVIDRKTRMRVQLHENDTVQGIKGDIEILLNEKP